MASGGPVRPSSDFLKAVGESTDSFYASLLDSLYDGVYFVDDERRITYWNVGAERLTGYGPAEMIGRFCYDNLLMHVTAAGCSLCTEGCPLHQTLADGERREAEVFLRHKQGHRVPVCVRVSPISGEDGAIIGAVEVFSDISAKKQLERKADELEGLAYFDGLTGVANRRYIDLKVQQAIQEVEQFDRVYGILLVDIDHFKAVNDDYGHSIGDVALKSISATLSNTIRPGDTVGRWGGDEFLIVVRDVNEESLRQLAERCCQLVASTAIRGKGASIRIKASIGATLLAGNESCHDAVNRADMLLYESKRAGKNCVHVG